MRGTGQDEPVLTVKTYGSGRVFHCILGHVWEGGGMDTFENADFQRVLDALAGLQSLQDQLLVTRGQVAANAIAAYKALGGGWQVHEADWRACCRPRCPPPPPPPPCVDPCAPAK